MTLSQIHTFTCARVTGQPRDPSPSVTAAETHFAVAVVATVTVLGEPTARTTRRARPLVAVDVLADIGGTGIEDARLLAEARGAAAALLLDCAAGDHLAVVGVLRIDRWTNRRGVSGESSRLVVHDTRVYGHAEVEP